MKINHIIYIFLQLTFGIIQNVIGFIIFLYVKISNPQRETFFYHGAIVSRWHNHGSLGCGMFIFLGHKGKIEKEILVHEYGHTIQSIILGPLFILIIAIPSLIWANMKVFVKMRREKRIKYTSLYCEKWASHLGELVLKEKAAHN